MNKITILLIALIIIQLFQFNAQANQCLEKITTAIENNTKNSPAIGLIVIKDGKTLYKKANGFSDIESKIQTTNQTPMSLCSISKQFTAAAILKLQEDKKLSVDDNINKYLDWLPEYAKDVKISNLLFHNSGISCYMNDNQEAKNLNPAKVLKDGFVADDRYIKSYIINSQPNFKTGSKYQYSNSGYWLLARIIEKVSGTSYSDYINYAIFKKIDAKNSYVNINKVGILEAQPYNSWPLHEKLPNAFSTYTKYSDGDGGIFMSLDDFEKYVSKGFLGGEIFKTKATYKKFMSPMFEIKKGEKYGFGLEFDETRKFKKIAHNGGIWGYTSNITYYPEKQLVVASFFGTETFAIEVLPEEIVQCF